MTEYAKGNRPIDQEDRAKGGPALGRVRDFLKEPDEFRDPDEGERKNADVVGDIADADQKYGKSGPGKGSGFGPKLRDVSKGETKVLKPVKPRT